MTNDLIGRAEAQTAIQFAAKRYTVAHEAHGEGQVVWSDNLIDVTDAMNVLRDLPSAQSEQQWVPCSERLPEKNSVYIVSYEDAVTFLEWFNGKWFFCPSNPAREETGTITAWMPLPEPYQGGE